MAMAWLAILAAFAESGFGAAVVQRAELEPEHLTTTFVITLAIGVLLGLLGVGLSWPAALVFSILNAAVLAVRIREENRALRR